MKIRETDDKYVIVKYGLMVLATITDEMPVYCEKFETVIILINIYQNNNWLNKGEIIVFLKKI